MVLLLDAMAACPELHELIHKDANEADHHCAVTVFAQGKVDSVSCEVPAVAPVTWIEIVPRIEFSSSRTAMAFLPDGRAPPGLPAVS